jgi:hypothetical protein
MLIAWSQVTLHLTFVKLYTLLLEQQPLNDLPKRTLFPRCYQTEEKVIIGKRLGIFPVYQKEMYRKYIIKPENLKNKTQ